MKQTIVGTEPVLLQAEVEEKYERKRKDYSLAGRVKHRLSRNTRKGCTGREAAGWLASFVPCIHWLSKYKWKSYLLRDLIAGLTVGIINVPQGMAYGLLAGLQPVYGLYTSMFFPFIYTFFGTSRHAAIGTFAVSSIMTADALDGMMKAEVGGGGANATGGFWCGLHSPPPNNTHIMEERVEIAVTLCFTIAIIHLVFGMLKLGFLTVLLSDQLIQGLTTGAAFHVLTSQVKYIFGLDPEFANYVRDSPELLPLIRFYGCFFTKIGTGFNWEPFVISIICVGVLIVVKLFIDPKTRPKIKFPIPIELIIVVVTTIISWQLSLDTHNVSTVSVIPKGLPSPRVPTMARFSEILPSAFSIGIMLYAIEVSVAKLFAEKYHYEIDANQEWFGLGLAHLFGSFFQCHPGGASMSRSMVQGSQGGKSQLVNMINAIIILVVLLAIADVFEYLPKCTLSAIIVVSLKGLFLQFEKLPDIWRKSRTDFLIWIITFAGTILFNVTWGLIIGAAASVLTILYRMLWPTATTLDRLPRSQVFQEEGTFHGQLHSHRVKIFRFKAPLSYLNVEEFKNLLYKSTGVDPQREKRKREKAKKAQKTAVQDSHPSNGVMANGHSGHSAKPTLQGIVIDCSSLSFVDIMGCDGLLAVYKDYSDVGINVGFYNLSGEALETLDRMDFFDKVPSDRIFFDLPSAVEELRLPLTETGDDMNGISKF